LGNTEVVSGTLSLDDDLAAILNHKAREEAFVVHPQVSDLMPGIDPLRFNQLQDQPDLEWFQAVQTLDREPS
jgi:hypothetical protein